MAKTKQDAMSTFFNSGRAHDLAAYLKTKPKDAMISRVTIETEGLTEGHDFRKHEGFVAQKKAWDKSCKARYDERKKKKAAK